MAHESVNELLPGVIVVPLGRFEDGRGDFVKTFSKVALGQVLGNFEMREEFYSTSARDVVRGMHFQLPPYEHVKLVYCASGAVLDVVLDLRRGPGCGRAASVMLDSKSPRLVVIPAGVAHGFRALVDGSLMVYKTSTAHVPSHDAGIRWDGFGFDWGVDHPTLSTRDAGHPSLIDFQSPF